LPKLFFPNPGGDARARLLRAILTLLAAIALALPLAPALAQEPESETAEAPDYALRDLEGRLGELKIGFENDLVGVKEQNAIQARSWKAMSFAFFMALGEMSPENYGDYHAKNAPPLDVIFADREKSWELKEISAIKKYYEALTRIVTILAGQKGDKLTLAKLKAILARPGSEPGKTRTRPTQEAEAKVFWSNRVAAVFPLAVELLAPEYSQELDDITEDMLNRAEIIAIRRDIHYRARLDLLYLNNVQSLASMLFLIAESPNSPFASEAKSLELTVETLSLDPQVQLADKISLYLVTSAQLTIPMAHWLATGP
jgi:hypothetical protein